jgi:hypothetical protein
MSGPAEPTSTFGSNIAQALLGGLCESLARVIGFGYLLAIAVAFCCPQLGCASRGTGLGHLTRRPELAGIPSEWHQAGT